MLTDLQECDFDKYIDFVWELGQDLTKSGYPTYTDGIKTKKDFIERERKSFSRENEEILLFEQNGQVDGWIHYRFESKDRYLDTCAFNVRTNTRLALEEFLTFIKKRFPGYELYLGFPRNNSDAVSYLMENGFTCLDESFHDVLFFDSYHLLPECSDVVAVTRDNFEDFRKLHRPVEDNMYWNCNRLFENLDNWHIYLCYQEGSAAGAIYYTDEKVMLEIFGVDFPNGVCNKEVLLALLTKALNEGKKAGAKYLCFFTDQDSHPVSLELGFHFVGEYVCCLKKI